jgi:hypothetical protein
MQDKTWNFQQSVELIQVTLKLGAWTRISSLPLKPINICNKGAHSSNLNQNQQVEKHV